MTDEIGAWAVAGALGFAIIQLSTDQQGHFDETRKTEGLAAYEGESPAHQAAGRRPADAGGAGQDDLNAQGEAQGPGKGSSRRGCSGEHSGHGDSLP